MRELDAKSVFVLPIRLDDAQVPVLLRDKRYADFRIKYNQGLDDLMRRIVPDSASSAMMQSVPELRLHVLPAILDGRILDLFDLNRVLFAINVLERTIGRTPTDIPLFRKGQRLFAREINQLLPPIAAVRSHLNLRTGWKGFPISDGQVFTAALINELYGMINETIEHVSQAVGRRDA